MRLLRINAELSGQTQIGPLQLPVRSLHGSRARDHNDIVAPGKLPLVQPVDLAQAAAQPVPVDRVAKLCADGQADAVSLRAVSAAVDDEVPIRAGIALIVAPAEHVIEFQGAGKLHRRLLMARSEVHAG